MNLLKPQTICCLLLLIVMQSCGTLAFAQLPVARGRELALSRPQWKLFIPESYRARGDQVDLLVHFHGSPQTVWNNAAYAELNVVVVTVNYSGLSSAYSNPFSDTTLFQQLLDSTQTTLAAQPDFGPATSWDQLAVSSFSAGYGAVRNILKTPAYFDAIDSLLAADSLYASTASDGTAVDSQMVDYKAFAQLAAAGEKRFVFTHSQVPTFTYESTEETGDELLRHIRTTTTPSQAEGLGTLQFYRTASRGEFQLWGATGQDGEAHLSHLRYLGEWLDDLGLSTTSLSADYNGDGVVDAADYTVWRDNWLQFDAPGDGDGDGFVGNTDYPIWAEQYGSQLAPVALSVPTPAGITCLAVALVQLAAPSWRVRR